MGDIRDFLDDHLRPMAGPYLFVGAGLSRRYKGLPSWAQLLEHFAEMTGFPLDYYRSAAGGKLPGAASKVAEAFHQLWWTDPKFARSRNDWTGRVGDSISLPLKIEISLYIEELDANASIPASLSDEWELLTKSTVEGVITTNYDRLLVEAFPDFRTFVGQDGLLFSDPQGIAETYAIHGSTVDPASLVLTAEDYKQYEERNAYLAAKLMTIFVEHPVVFIGYGFGDDNIQSILKALVRGLKDQSVVRLSERLIFVEWHKTLEGEPYREESFVNVDDYLIPIIRLHVRDWIDLFASLGRRQHALPARTLRHLKEQVYDIVQGNDPDERLYAITDIDSENASQVEIVFGVGAKVSAVGIVGLKRQDLFQDVLERPDRGMSALEVLDKFYDGIQAAWWAPAYRYLRQADQLDATGNLKPDAFVKQNVRDRIARINAAMVPNPGTQKQTIEQLVTAHDEHWVLTHAFEMPGLTDDSDGLRALLIDTKDAETGSPARYTAWGRAVVAYDYMKFGPGPL